MHWLGRRVLMKAQFKLLFLCVICIGISLLSLDPQEEVATCTHCFVNKFRFLQNASEICKVHQDGPEVDMLFLIFSTYNNTEARNAIRSTWMSASQHNRANIRYVFLFGESVTKEQRTSITAESNALGDIVIGNFTDSYRNLTLKTLMGFQWAAKFCQNTKAVVKTDDDMFINVPNLLKVVHDNNETIQNSVVGKCYSQVSPVRDLTSKWYTAYHEYPKNRFPRFCSGTCYITSVELINKILNVSVNVPFFHLEDVYIGMCLSVLKTTVTYLEGFNTDNTLKDICYYKTKNAVSFHRINPEILHLIWNAECFE